MNVWIPDSYNGNLYNQNVADRQPLLLFSSVPVVVNDVLSQWRCSSWKKKYAVISGVLLVLRRTESGRMPIKTPQRVWHLGNFHPSKKLFYYKPNLLSEVLRIPHPHITLTHAYTRTHARIVPTWLAGWTKFMPDYCLSEHLIINQEFTVAA